MALGLGTAVAYLDLDATGFARGIDTAILDAQKLKTGFSNISDTTTKVGMGIAGLGKIITAGVTLPIVGFGAASVKSGAEFDTSMSNVKAVSMNAKSDITAVSEAAKRLGVDYKQGATDGETAFNALRATAIKMGNDTRYTAKESADALYYMGLAGWNAEQMINGIPGVLSLASAGQADLATTSDIVTDAITGFGHTADETANVIKNGVNQEIPIATRLADIMAATMANSNTDVLMLGEAFKYVSPIAGSFGYSMEDISLSLGLMANAGVKASQAGTTLRQGLKRLVAPTDKAQESMNKYGWSAYDAEGKTKPLRQQLEELRGIFGKLDIEVKNADGSLKTSEQIMEEYGRKLPVNDQERLTDAVNVFGTTALPGMLALMGATDESFNDLAKSIDESSGAFDGLGYSQGMAAIQLDNLQGDWILFTSALGTAKQVIFDLLNGPLRGLVQGLTDLVRKFNEADPSTQKMILKMAAFAAAIGPVLVVGGKLLSWIATVRSGFSSLGNATKIANKAFDTVSDTSSILANAFINTGIQKDALLNNFLQVPGATGTAGKGFAGLTTAAGGTGKALTTLSPQIKSISGREIPKLATVSTSASLAVGGLAAEVLDVNGKVIATTTAFEKAAPKVTGFAGVFQKLKMGVSSVFSSLGSYVTAFVTTLITSFAAGEGVIGSFTAAFESMTVAMATNPIGIIVVAIAAAVAALGVLIYQLATQEEAVKSLDEATKNHEETIKNLTSAQGSYIDSIKSVKDTQNELAQAQQETGLSAEELYNQFMQNKDAYMQMSPEQQRVLDLYIQMQEKQQKLKETTEELSKAQSEELIASFQQQASAIKENGGNWNEYGANIRKAYDEGKISQDEFLRLCIESMTEMDEGSKATFAQNIPEDLRAMSFIGAKEAETMGQKWDNFCSDVSKLFGMATDGIKSIWQDIGGWFGDRWNDIVGVFSGVADWFRDKFNEAKFAINYTFAPVVQFFEDTWNSIKFTWGVVAVWFESIINEAKFRIMYVFGPIIQFFEDTWNKIKFVWGVVASWFGGESENAESNMESPWGDIGGFFGRKWDEIKDKFKIGDLFTWGSDMINNFIDGIKERWERLKGTITGIAEFIASIFKHTVPKDGPLKDDDKWTAHMMDNFINGIENNKDKLKNSINSVADIMAEPMTTELNGVFNSNKNQDDLYKKSFETGKIFSNGLADGINIKQMNPLEIFNLQNIKGELKVVLEEFSSWYKTVIEDMSNLSLEMLNQVQGMVDKTNNMLYNIDKENVTNKNMFLRGAIVSGTQNKQRNNMQPTIENIVNNTNNNFYSPKPIDEIEASRLLKQTSRDLAEGFS